MTQREFLKRVSSSGPWVLNEKGQISLVRDGSVCPWLAVDGKGCNVEVTGWLVENIWDAADNHPSHDPSIRASLLTACNLTERSTALSETPA